MKWTDYNGETLVVEEQEKTGARAELTAPRELRKLLSAPRTSDSGRSYDATMLSKHLQTRLKEVGQPAGKFVLHGLRKAAAVHLAERGATVKQLMDWFGWRSAKKALYYVEQAPKNRHALGRGVR
jgi:integrase